MKTKSIIKYCLLSVLVSLCFALGFATFSHSANVAYALTSNMCNFESAVLKNDVDSKSFMDFTKDNYNAYNVFAGQEIDFTINANNSVSNLELKADEAIVFVDGSSVLTGGVLGSSATTYLKTIKCDEAGQYNITLIGKIGESIYYDSLTLNVFDALTNLNVALSDEYVTDNQEVSFNFIYNNASEAIYNGVVVAKFTNGENEIQVSTADYSSFGAVVSFDSGKLVLNTSLLGDSWNDFSAEFKIGDVKATANVKILDLEKPTVAILNSTTATYNLYDGTGLFYIYLNENSKPNISVVDNSNAVSLNKFYKVESDKSGYDKIAIELNLNSITNFSNILFIIDGKDDDIYKSSGIAVINEINSIKIEAGKNILEDKEKININAIVNGKSDYNSNVEWFVNDIKVDDVASTLSFAKSGGTYTIYAKIGDVQSNSLVLTVKYSLGNVIFWYVLLALCIIAIIVLVLTRKKKGKINFFGTLTENIDELTANVRLLDSKFSKKLARKIYRDMALVKERCLYSYEENEEQLYGFASKSLQIAYKEMRKLVSGKISGAERVQTISKIWNELENANDALLEYKRICASTSEN